LVVPSTDPATVENLAAERHTVAACACGSISAAHAAYIENLVPTCIPWIPVTPATRPSSAATNAATVVGLLAVRDSATVEAGIRAKAHAAAVWPQRALHHTQTIKACILALANACRGAQVSLLRPLLKRHAQSSRWDAEAGAPHRSTLALLNGWPSQPTHSSCPLHLPSMRQSELR